MSSSGPHDQNRAASVMSIAASVVATIADFAAEQAEAGIDVAGEGFQKLVDDAGASHRLLLSRSGDGWIALRQPALILWTRLGRG